MLKAILKFLKAFNSNSSPKALAVGMALGLIMAQYPAGNLQWVILLLFIMFLFKVNLPSYSAFLLIFSLLPAFLNPLANIFGRILLEAQGLEKMWTGMYNSTLWYLTAFNNTVVLGMSLLFIPLFILFYFFFKWLIKLYRTKLRDKIVDSKAYKAFMKLSIVSKIAKVGTSIKWE